MCGSVGSGREWLSARCGFRQDAIRVMGRSAECFRNGLYRIGTEEEGTKRNGLSMQVGTIFKLNTRSQRVKVRISLSLVAESLQTSIPVVHDGASITGI